MLLTFPRENEHTEILINRYAVISGAISLTYVRLEQSIWTLPAVKWLWRDRFDHFYKCISSDPSKRFAEHVARK